MRFRTRTTNTAYRKALVQSVGARMLDRLCLPLGTVAQTVGVTPMSVSRYVRGLSTPLDETKVLFEAHYDIPFDSWERVAYTSSELYAMKGGLALPTAPLPMPALPTTPLEGPPPGEVDLP